MSTYTRWYRDGSAALTKGSSAVVGTNTYWLTAGLNPGDIFKVDGVDYEIVSITDNTHLTLAGNYTGTTGSDKAYAIVRNFTANTQARMAAQTAELLGDFSKYIDTDMQSIHGKSAYQIACEKGYVGTESEWVKSLEGASAYEVAVANGYNGTVEEWLEALKAAGEWADADSRISVLEAKTMRDALINDESITQEQRNAIYGGRNLGVFTEDHYKALTQQNGKGLAVGDYFYFPEWNNKLTGDSCRFRIVGFKQFANMHVPNMTLMPAFRLYSGADRYLAPYIISYNSAAIGTEGEEGYVPSTNGNCYPESNWYVNLRPKFIEWCETQFLGHLLEFEITVPAAQTGGTVTSIVNLDSKAHLPTFSMLTGQMHPWIVDYRKTHAVWQTYNYEEFPLFNIAPWFRYPGSAHTPLGSCAENGTFLLSSYIFYTDTGIVTNCNLRPVICIG